MLQGLTRLIIACGLLWCALAHAGPLWAYYQSSHAHSSNQYSLDPVHIPTKKDHSRLALYPDVEHLLNGGKDKEPYFDVFSSQLSPAYAIDLNPKVIMSRGAPATTLELSLKNLLYANVKLQKLVQEYERVQKRARELLDGLEDPLAMDATAASNQVQNSTLRQSLQTLKEVLERWQKHDSRRNLAVLQRSMSKEDIQDSILGSLVALREYVQDKGSFFQSAGEKKNGSSLDHDDAVPIKPAVKQHFPIEISSERQQTELPVFLKRILSLLRTVVDYRIEVLIIGLSLFALYGLILATRRT